MAKTRTSLGVHVGPASRDDEVFAGATPPPVLQSCVFDEASCGTTEPDTIPKGTPVGIITAEGLDDLGRPTVGVHDPDAVDGRENPIGLLLFDIIEADGTRSPSAVDCPCVVVRGGRVWDSVIPEGAIGDVPGHPARCARGDVLIEGTAGEEDTVTVTVAGEDVVVTIADGDTAAVAAGKIASALNQDADFRVDYLAVAVVSKTDATEARVEIIALRPGAWANEITLVAVSATSGITVTASGEKLAGGLNDNSYRKQALLRACPGLILEVGE